MNKNKKEKVDTIVPSNRITYFYLIFAKPVEYLKFFAAHNKLTYFFGDAIILYAIVYTLALPVLLVSGFSFENYQPLARILAIAVFVLMSALATAGFASKHLSIRHDQYLSYVGFSPRNRRTLTRMITLPVTISESLLLVFIFTDGLPNAVRVLLTVAIILLIDALLTAFLELGRHRGALGELRIRKKRSVKRTGLSMMRNPYTSFFKKDFLAIRSFKTVALFSIIQLAPIASILIACILPFSNLHIILLYIAVIPNTWFLFNESYGADRFAYQYYRTQLRIADTRLIRYKLVLPFSYAAIVAGLFFILTGHAHGYYYMTPLIMFCLLLYLIILGLALGNWYIYWLKKGRFADSYYELVSLAIGCAPGVCIVALMLNGANWILRRKSVCEVRNA